LLEQGVSPSLDEDLNPQFDERVTVEAAQKGDTDALGILYEYYFPRVFRFVSVRVFQQEDAEDIVNEIFMRIVSNISRFRWEGAPFGAWVFRIARNEVVNHIRRSSRQLEKEPLFDSIPDEKKDHVGDLEKEEALEYVRAASASLPAAQRDVIALRFGADLSVAETAKVLGKTENNIKVLQHKAIVRLREIVKL
tara:strand:+ start:10283 stop:10864 length:582 start_codon:yes stop_codon:yes gene_type:complete